MPKITDELEVAQENWEYLCLVAAGLPTDSAPWAVARRIKARGLRNAAKTLPEPHRTALNTRADDLEARP